MDATKIAEYFLTKNRAYTENCHEIYENIFGSRRAAKDSDHIGKMMDYFLRPPLCDELPNVEFQGQIFQDISWDMDEDEFKSFCNQLRAAVILAEWMHARKFNEALAEFQGKRFCRVFELLISLSKVNENINIEWGDDAGNSGDGGIDGYGTVDSETLYIIQSKAQVLKASFYREMFGTYLLLKKNSEYRKTFTRGIDQVWPYAKTILILMSSREPSHKLRLKNDKLYRADGSIEFVVMDPWAISWFLVTKTNPEIFSANEWTIGEQKDVDLLIAELSILAEEQNPAASVDPNDY